MKLTTINLIAMIPLCWLIFANIQNVTQFMDGRLVRDRLNLALLTQVILSGCTVFESPREERDPLRVVAFVARQIAAVPPNAPSIGKIEQIGVRILRGVSDEEVQGAIAIRPR